MNDKLEKIISQITLEEKTSLCSGSHFWSTKAIEKLGIPSIMMCDGPHGLRKQGEREDELGFHTSVPATCFPTAATLACSWDRDLLKNVGSAIGEECQTENVSIFLGPGVNIKRSPLCCRNFEYLSEDPYLATEMAASHINGVQSQGVGTSLKHFAVNNQEDLRFLIDAVVEERVFREIYLAAFESAKILYAPGYQIDESTYGLFNADDFKSNADIVDDTLLNDAIKIAERSDAAVVFAGLPDSYEYEGYDRTHIRIPIGHMTLIEKVAKVQKNIVVVLSNGSPIEMPWLRNVKGVLERYLGGQAFGGAVADILFAVTNPCGKLAESFPKKIEDNPSYINFLGDREKVEYHEGLSYCV